MHEMQTCFQVGCTWAGDIGIAIPAILTLAADPVASLIDTIFIGRLGQG